MTALFLCLHFFIFPAHAEDSLHVDKVVSGDTFTLTDGRTVRLEGIMIPDEATHAEAARTALLNLTRCPVVLNEDAALDRYGRLSANVRAIPCATNKGLNIQTELVRTGVAFVGPPLGTESHLADLMKTEREARAAKRGIWASMTDLPADKTDGHEGQFVFVRGKVVAAARVKNKVYLNFGTDWRMDFTVEIAAKNLRTFRKIKLDPLNLENQTVRVRGVLQKTHNGPMIEVTCPEQIEILP